MTSTLTPPEIAQMLRVKPSKVLGWIARGELGACNVADRLGGRPRWRIRQEDLDVFLLRRAAAPRPVMSRTRKVEVPSYV
jgi:excisionase family DNA binding protein